MAVSLLCLVALWSAILLTGATDASLLRDRQFRSFSAHGPRDADDADYSLPENLLIGAGVSAFQTEGAWNIDGKAESAVDHLLNSSVLASLGYGDTQGEHGIAADSYHKYKDDVKAAAELKLKLYRFSISWARLLPTADASQPNEMGVKYYNGLIDEIIKYNMTPMATLHHFDHPQILEDQYKGWQGREMVGKFKEYARFAFEKFADRVKMWTTINEPNMYCVYFPMLFRVAGLRTEAETDEYQCVHNMVLAHMEAYEVFKNEIKPKHGGMVGTTAKLMPAAPSSTNQQDTFLAEAFNQMHAGNVLHPTVFGDYPPLYKQLTHSEPLPEFTPEQKEKLKGSSDFLGLNVYFGMKVSYREPSDSNEPNMQIPGVGKVMTELPQLALKLDVHGNDTSMLAGYTSIEPQVIERALLWTWESYGIPIVITENGYGDVTGLASHDHERAAYHSAILRSLAKTVNKYDITVLGYCVWSLVDAFEWSGGFKRPFGLVHVDYEGKTLARSLKESASFFQQLAASGTPRVVPFVAPTPEPEPSGARGLAATWAWALALLLWAARA